MEHKAMEEKGESIFIKNIQNQKEERQRLEERGKEEEIRNAKNKKHLQDDKITLVQKLILFY